MLPDRFFGYQNSLKEASNMFVSQSGANNARIQIGEYL
jgi:hypothetical protein